MARPRGSVAGVPPMVIVEIDGAPYVDVDWLEQRIYRDRSRMQIWRQEARRFARRTDPDGIALCAAYRWQALAMSYRLAKWRRSLAATNEALAGRQLVARVEFGPLLKERRLAAGMNLRELAALAGVDHKTILNVERALFLPSRRSLERILAVRELRLTWADVNPALLQANPADGRKHRKPKQTAPAPTVPKRKGRSRRKRRNRRFRS